MEDSPLSIAANIAGLLTFVVAIFASIYVRYMSLRTGIVEMMTIWQTSQDDVKDLEESQTARNLIITENDERYTVWLKKLAASLAATELVIFVYLARVRMVDTASVEDLLLSTQWVGITPTTIADAAQEIRETSKRDGFIKKHYSLAHS